MAKNRAASARRGETKDTPAELNFDDDRSAPPNSGYARQGSVEHDHASIYDEDGLGDSVDNTPSANDLTPETMIDETGGDVPLMSADAADSDLSVVDEDDIGGGEGLDEAELAIAEGGGPSGEEDDDDLDGDDEDELDDEDEDEEDDELEDEEDEDDDAK